MEPLLSIQDLSKTYEEKQVLKSINLEVNPGEIVGFIGANGAGKTTTIKCIVNLINYNDGSIVINGNDVNNNEANYKSSFGFVADNPFLYEVLTGEEYIHFLAELWNVSVNDAEISRLLSKFQLTEAYSKKIAEYSYGMKKKIAIIGALVHQPKLLILDEPLNGLDPTSAYIAKEFLKEYAQRGNGVFFSSHTLEVVEKLCDKIAILKDGDIIACSSLDEIKQEANQSLEEFFMEVVNNNEAI
ncbi:TPA: ABC transporter ATP-binding protein [Bacillus cereus]